MSDETRFEGRAIREPITEEYANVLFDTQEPAKVLEEIEQGIHWFERNYNAVACVKRDSTGEYTPAYVITAIPALDADIEAIQYGLRMMVTELQRGRINE